MRKDRPNETHSGSKQASRSDPSHDDAGGTSEQPVQRKPLPAGYLEYYGIQRSSDGDAAAPSAVHDAAVHGTSGASEPLPHLDAIQRSFGRHDVSRIEAHTGGDAQVGARAMGAEAFAVGDHVAFAGAPDLHTAAHEAAHVVQQRGGVQLKGGVGEEGDTYERHADAVAERVVAGQSAEALLDSYAPSSPSGGRAGPAEALRGGAIQRKLKYKEKLFTTMKEVSADRDVFNAVQSFKKSLGAKVVTDLLEDKVKVYDLEDGLKEVSGKDVPVEVDSKQKSRDKEGARKTTDIQLPFKKGDYPKGSTLYAPIDHAIIVINNGGGYQFVGTSGLLGCVEVMIEYHTGTDSGYLVAHVNSHIGEDEAEIRSQLTIMLDALGRHLNKEIKWSDFGEGSKTTKLTLVRDHSDVEQTLLVNMRNILAESGAHMHLVNSTSASMEITVQGAKYYDNHGQNVKTDYRKEPGYPFPEDA
jgi:hypothetical protein